DTFQNLIKVRLDAGSQPHAEEGHKSDSGAPVYLPHFDRFGIRILDVRPVVDRIIRDSRSTGGQLELIGENIA
ncbi:8914_t:CDS:2, partial [Funneliformis geosporum]